MKVVKNCGAQEATRISIQCFKATDSVTTQAIAFLFSVITKVLVFSNHEMSHTQVFFNVSSLIIKYSKIYETE